MHAKSVLAWGCLALAATALACTSSEASDDATGGSGGTVVEPVAPTVAAMERLGSFRPGPARAVLSCANKSFDLIGHAGVEINPADHGLVLPVSDSGTAVYGGGFSVLDRTTGRVRFYDKADGLPEVVYEDGFIFGTDTAPVFAMTWVVQDQVFAAAAWDWVIVGTLADDGSISFASTKVRAENAGDDAFVATVAALDGEIYAGTNQGLAVIDPTTLAVTRWADVGLSLAGNPFIWDLAAGDLGGTPAVVAIVGTYEQPTHVVVVGPTASDTLFLESGETPTALGAIPGTVLVGVREADGRGSLRGLYPALGGDFVLDTFLSPEALATVENPNLIPAKLAYDSGRNLLLVGGSFVGNGPSQPIALATVNLDGEPRPKDVVDSRDPYYWAMPWNVDALAVDGLGRWYVAGRSLCSEIHTRQLGLYRYEPAEDETLRIVRPWVSGIRSIEVDPVVGDTWLGMKDSLPNLACFGQAVQAGVCRLKADGSCELWAPRINANADGFSATPAVTDIAFGDPAKKQVALATTRSGLFLRNDDTTRALNPTSDPGSSLWMTSVAFGDEGDLWMGSLSQWMEMPGFTPEELEAIDSRTPHGVGYFKIGAEAFPVRESFRRYSRIEAIAWNKDYDTAGMPSNTAYDVVPLPGPQHALVACGVERGDRIVDHVLPEPSPANIAGGIAEIVGTDVHVFAPPAGVAFGDVMALARRPDGATFALDAAAGIVQLDLETRTSTLFAPALWTAPERGLSLAVDASGRLAVGTTAGLYVFGPTGLSTTVFASGHGFVWSVRFVADGVLYAGTDQGLVRVALDATTLPVPGRTGAQPRELWELPLGCNGEDGCACTDGLQCAPGLTCNCDENWNCSCGVFDPCLANPGAEGCACRLPAAISPCQEGLACLCEGEECTCQVDPAACGGEVGCACSVDTDCRTGLSCGNDGCFDPAACSADCSCPTDLGCPEGLVCTMEGCGPPPCEDNCTCETATGCPEGETCQTWTDPEGVERPYCDYPPECKLDCSCATESGCPEGYFCMERTDGTTYCRVGL